MYACIGDPMCKTNHFVVNKELLCSMLLYRRHTNVTCNHVIEGSHMCFASVDIVTDIAKTFRCYGTSRTFGKQTLLLPELCQLR